MRSTSDAREKVRPVFVVGVGRSGTSLVQAMLHAHPQIAFLPETHFCRRYVLPVFQRMRVRLLGPRRFTAVLEQDSDFRRVDLEAGELLEPFSGGNENTFTPEAVYARLLRHYRGSSDACIVGDKDPRLIDFLPGLSKYFPKARVIHVIRDPRDVLVSRREAAWSRGRSDLSHMLAYRAQLQRGRASGPRCFGERYQEVRYEDLLREPAGTLKRLCGHIGVEYDPAMMSFGESAGELVADEEREWKKETMGPLKRDNVGNWRGELSADTRTLIDAICLASFPELGYGRALKNEAEGLRLRDRFAHRFSRLLGAVFSCLYPIRVLVG